MSPGPDYLSTMPVATFAAFRHRNFRVFYIGQSLSVVGLWMHGLAQGWLILELTDSAFYVGLASALVRIPVMLFTFYAGVVADRMEKRTLIMICQAGAMVLAFLLAWLTFTDAVRVGHVLVITTLVGVTIAFEIPARQAFVVELVGKEDVTNAVALNSSAFNASRILGPAIAGILVATFGVAVCFLINGLSFLFSLGALWSLKLERRVTRRASRSAMAEMRRGLEFIRNDARIFPLIVVIGVLSLFAFPYEVLLPILARDVMGRGSVEYGWMVSAAGVGALVGALGLATVAARVARGKLVLASAVVFGCSIIALSVAGSVAAAVGVLVVAGLGMILTTSTTNTLLQTLAPDEYRGRVMAAYTWAFLGLGPLGSLFSGWVAEAFGVPVAFRLGGVAVIVAVTIVALKNKELVGTR